MLLEALKITILWKRKKNVIFEPNFGTENSSRNLLRDLGSGRNFAWSKLMQKSRVLDVLDLAKRLFRRRFGQKSNEKSIEQIYKIVKIKNSY